MTNIKGFSDEELKAEIERRKSLMADVDMCEFVYLDSTPSFRMIKNEIGFLVWKYIACTTPVSDKQAHELHAWLSKFFPAPQIDLSDIDWENIDHYSDFDAEDLGVANQMNANDYLRDLRKIVERVRPKQELEK